MAQDNSNANGNRNSKQPRVWLITGCSSGFGRALAEAVLAHGDSVLATSRNPDDLAELEKSAGDHADRMARCKLDVTSPDQCLAAVEFAVETFGKLDVLVNNAGYGLLGGLEELNDDEIEQQFNVNFFGPLRLMRKALHHWRSSETAGHIVNMGAIAAWDYEMGFAVYGASKAALETAGGAVAREARPLGVGVTSVIPGPFRTDFIGRSMANATGRIEAYEKTVGKFAQTLDKMAGKQPGDPAKAAHAIIEAVEAKSPPSRLFLGSYAHDKIGKVLDAVNRDVEKWESIGKPTDDKS